MYPPSSWPADVPTRSRRAARRSVPAMPHARSKTASPHAALRAADVNKSYGYANSNQTALLKHWQSM